MMRFLGMGMTLSFAETASWVANWVLVFALALGVAATYFIVVTGVVKERASKEEVEAAKIQIAEANARTAEAQRDLVALTGQTQRRIPWGGKMVPFLKQATGTVEIAFQEEDFESLNVVKGMQEIFKASGWTVSRLVPMRAQELMDRHFVNDWWTVSARILNVEEATYGSALAMGHSGLPPTTPTMALVAAMNAGFFRPKAGGRIIGSDASIPEGVLRLVIFPR